MKLTDLNGVGTVTAKKLNDAGIMEVTHILTKSIPDISEITGMDSASAKKLYSRALKGMREEALIGKRFSSGREKREQRENVECIDTGSTALNKLLGGKGLEVDATTETYGEFGSGKTQFGHTLAVMVQRLENYRCPNCKDEVDKSKRCEKCFYTVKTKGKEKNIYYLATNFGGLSTPEKRAKCLWIDSEDTFRPERIETIAEMNDMDGDECLDNIIHAKAYNSADQQLVLEEAENMIVSENIKLIVVDSAMGLFRSDYVGRGRLSDRQGQVNNFVTLAGRIAGTYHVAIILTNQVMHSPAIQFGDPTRPIGGDIFAHASTYRIYFKKAGIDRIGKMIDSPNSAEIEVRFALSDRGVCDCEQRDEDDKQAKKENRKKKKDGEKDEIEETE